MVRYGTLNFLNKSNSLFNIFKTFSIYQPLYFLFQSQNPIYNTLFQNNCYLLETRPGIAGHIFCPSICYIQYLDRHYIRPNGVCNRIF